MSVLESDIDSRSQLESSVESIVRRLSTSNEQNLDAEAKALKIELETLYSKLKKVDQELVDAREGEYRDVVIAGQSYMPSEAARKIAQEKGRNDWIPAPVVAEAALPLSEGELIDLYESNNLLSPANEIELSQKLPSPKEVPTPEDFAKIVNEKVALSKLDPGLRSDLWDFSPTMESLEELELFAERFSRAMEQLASNCESDWKLAAVFAGRIGGQGRTPWENLLSFIKKICSEATAAQENLVRYGLTLPERMPSEEQKRIVEEILGHFEDGGKLNRLVLLMNRSWNRFIQESKVGEGPPSRYDHFRALRDAIHLKIDRRDLSARWDRQVGSLGAPSSAELGTEPENACAQYIQSIRGCLEWYNDFWGPLEKDIRNLGFRWEKFFGEQPPNPASYGDLLRLRDAATALAPIIFSRMNAVRMLRIKSEITAIAQKLLLYIGEKRSSLTVKRLREAIGNLDSESYREAFQQLVDMYNLREKFELRHDLLNRLEKVAPAWADAIRNRRGRHGDRDLPGDPVAGWLWRQLHDELERRSQKSLELLQQAICSLNDELRQVTADLIDRRAWAAQVRRTTLSQRQALIGWLDTERRIGRGYGKRVPRLRAEARRKMSECRTAVPVWIMPLARVVENFDPRTTRFDVVIIDEASQSDAMALLALYLARKVVVVGDHEQVSPVAVGQDLAVIQHLIDEYLQGIPNFQLYDGQMSIYDLARQSFGGAICLVEHFRCVPDIIQFSNQLSYKGEIKPLRDSSLVQLKPHVISYRINASRSREKVNSEEAWAVASLLAAAIEQPEFKDKTFGVISLVGEEQAREIERLLLRYLAPEEYHRRRILCGNSAQFQGDERDIMFLSMVDTNSSNGPLPLREQQMFRQRFNVAASRPRDQMWLI